MRTNFAVLPSICGISSHDRCNYVFMQQRRAAEASKEPEMTLDEINAEIRAAREERRKKQQMVFGEVCIGI